MRLPAHICDKRSQRGFNLVELMIALALGLIIILGASNIFLSSKQSYRTNAAISQIQENSRIAFELLTRDLRQARLTGCGNQGSVNNRIKNNTDTGNWFADFANRGLIGFGGDTADDNPALTTGTDSGNHKTGTDNVTLIGAGDTSYSLASDYDAATGLDITESDPALDNGDIVIVCDTSQADIAQITAVSSGKFKIEKDQGTPGNSDNINNYSGSTTLVSALKSVTWYIGCNPTTASCDPAKGETSLYRRTRTESQEMARGVASMNLTYHQSSDTDFTEADSVTSWDPTIIDAVRIAVRFVANDRSQGADKLIFRDLSTTVTLRNPPKD
jgi:type IV pilus assembly protein PilW